jgi:4-diphosphocytidyl-2-C-methyl-D-erythritol kinase
VHGLAYAKINLTLEVTGKRPDGYHELTSLLQTVSLADELSFEAVEDLSLDCDVPDLAGDDNLVLAAARLLGRKGRFLLRKRIPAAAGLGGGSSDAALALRLLDAAHHLNLSHEQLTAAAAQLGSDVPFFLHGGTALVEGRGERVTPLPDLPAHWLVLLNPGVALSTPRVFQELRLDEYARPPAEASAPREGTPVLPAFVNTLEAPALRLEPAIAHCREQLHAAGASQVLLSGSGPTVFGLAAGEAEARRMAQQTGGWAVRFVPREEAAALQC